VVPIVSPQRAEFLQRKIIEVSFAFFAPLLPLRLCVKN
jgi:hypothetical protein